MATNKIYTIRYSPSDSKMRLKSEIVAVDYDEAMKIAEKNYKNRGYKRIVVTKTGKKIS